MEGHQPVLGSVALLVSGTNRATSQQRWALLCMSAEVPRSIPGKPSYPVLPKSISHGSSFQCRDGHVSGMEGADIRTSDNGGTSTCFWILYLS